MPISVLLRSWGILSEYFYFETIDDKIRFNRIEFDAFMNGEVFFRSKQRI